MNITAGPLGAGRFYCFFQGNHAQAAVGVLEDPLIAEAALANEEADLAAVGRGMLDDPYWALHAVRTVDRKVEPPVQYERGIYVR